MSNYLGKAKNPNTGNLEDCEFLDDFYGKRKYAVRFKDGTTYPESEVEGQPMTEHKPEPWQDKFLREGDANSCGDLSIMIRTVSEILANQNTANAERIRGLIQMGKGGHGECCMCTRCKNWHEDCTCAENRIAEAAAKLVENHA